MYDSFEQTIDEVARKSDFKNIALGQRLDEKTGKYRQRQEMMREVATAANLDPSMLANITMGVDQAFQEKAGLVRRLQQEVARVTKSHNDVVRTYQAKLSSYGIPEEELQLRKLMTETSTVPAGLVSTM